MAASIKTCLFTNLNALLRSNSVLFSKNNCAPLTIRHYSRAWSRKPVNVNSSKDEQNRLHKSGKYDFDNAGLDPTKNPYIEYNPRDPVQNNLKDMARSKKRYASKEFSDYDHLMADQEKLNLSEQSRTQSSKSKPVHEYQERQAKPASDKRNYYYEKLEPGSKIFSRRVMYCKTRDQREKRGIILLEGRRLVVDAIKAGARIKELFITDTEILDMLPPGLDIPIYKIPYKDAKIWSDTQSPSGIIAIFEKPSQGEVYHNYQRLPISIICDQIRDPGNMGSIVRLGAAVGCERILTVKGCVDAWEPKVIRAGMSSHFHIPIISQLTWNNLLNYLPTNCQILVADNRTPEKISQKFDMKNLDKYQEMEGFEENDNEDENPMKFSTAQHKFYKVTPLPLTSYDKLDIKSNVALIIGGETNGISPEAKKLVFDSYGQVVTIPMMSDIKSVNVTTATSVILYEIRRQLCLKQNQEPNISEEID